MLKTNRHPLTVAIEAALDNDLWNPRWRALRVLAGFTP